MTSSPPKDKLRWGPEIKGLVEGMYLMGATDFDVAEELGVTTRTIKNWRVKYEDFAEVSKITKQAADDIVERSLYQKACDGDNTAMIFWLKNRQPQKWRDVHKVEGKVVTNIVREIVEAKDDDV